MQTKIPYWFMRGGTSRGPYFQRKHLPDDLDTLAQVLISVLGSGHPLNIDGIGGSETVTTKVAMLSPSDDEWADIDYFFAQVSVLDRKVDFKPSCGNILSGVAPAAIEMGLIKPAASETQVRIKAVNTNARVLATVKTPDSICYSGDTSIDGVPGTGSPITLQFMDTVGGATGSFLPTGQTIDTFNAIDVTCMDVAMPVVMARADAFNLSGHETASELNDNKDFMQRMEQVRLQAAIAMGMGDATDSVVPKFALLASASKGGSVAARYFMPRSCHPTMAVTGAQCIATCLLTPGSVANSLLTTDLSSPASIVIEHPSGSIDVVLEFNRSHNEFEPVSAGIVRTARKLADGNVYIPEHIWV